MIYPFQCGNCGRYIEVYRTASDSGLPEQCSDCGEWMDRVWTVPMVSVVADPYYNEGLGIKVTGKNSIKDHINMVHDTTGREIVEVGNEKANVKKKKSDYNFTNTEIKDMHAMLSD